MNQLPNGARPILQARMNGEKPADLIIVSQVGALPDESNPVVISDGQTYDWRFLRGLIVCIFCRQGTPTRHLAIEIGCRMPSKLMLWDVETKRGADVTSHIKLDALDLRPSEFEKPRNWTAFIDPWLDFQNKQFEARQ